MKVYPFQTKETHRMHIVQWRTWEGMQYRLWCHTCNKYLDEQTQTPQSLKRFQWKPPGV